MWGYRILIRKLEKREIFWRILFKLIKIAIFSILVFFAEFVRPFTCNKVFAEFVSPFSCNKVFELFCIALLSSLIVVVVLFLCSPHLSSILMCLVLKNFFKHVTLTLAFSMRRALARVIIRVVVYFFYPCGHADRGHQPSLTFVRPSGKR